MANPTDPTTGGAKAPSYLQKTLKARARARLANGEGGAATYARLGMKPPKPKPVSPPKPAKPAIDPQTQAVLDAAVRMKFGGAESALNSSLQNNARFSNGVPTWYAQAINEIKGQQRPVPVVQAPAPIQPTGDPMADQAAQAR